MSTVVLVPGACHGGWWYRPVVERLAAEGRTAVALTLSGLDPDRPGPDRSVTLDDHVAEVVAAVDAVPGDGRDVVLVGHSYGGFPVTAAADARPGRVAALVYLDALVPEDGASCWSTTDDAQRRWYGDAAADTGTAVAPLPFFDPRARPHPLATLLQRIRLTGAWRQVPVRHYAVALRWPGPSPMATSVARVRGEAGVVVHEWDTRHDVLAEGPDRVLDLLRAV